MPVTLLFKETEVSLAKNLSGQISMRNRFSATVAGIERGTLLTAVVLTFDNHKIGSIITTRSCDALALSVGDAVEALVKTSEMTLMPEGTA
jgi:molybdate transport system regulatory protein